MHLNIENNELTNFHCRSDTKGGVTAMFLKISYPFTPYRLDESTQKSAKELGTGVNGQTNLSKIAKIRG